LKIIVDTSIWSPALRRPAVGHFVSALRDLVESGQVVMLGCIRQEILSGIRSSEQFALLRDQLRAFPDEPLLIQDYERAAEFFNVCRKRGIQGSNTDFLICAGSSGTRACHLYNRQIFQKISAGDPGCTVQSISAPPIAHFERA
jgi:predicted nucleic acid-binding protein